MRMILHGCNGKMGKVICALAESDAECHIVAGIDPVTTSGSTTFPQYQSLEQCEMPADVAVDFSTADAVDSLLAYCVAKKIPVVICTTGLSEETKGKIQKASETIAVFQSANMSLGINLIANLAGRIAPVLKEAGFDIEIVERHHNQKVDAPSGSALLLADTVNAAFSEDQKLEYIYDRSQYRKKRSDRELGIHALRGGTIVGEHTIVFAGKDEVIEMHHSAGSKDVFAVGAFRASRYLIGKAPGLYSMQDMLSEIL